MNRTEFLIYRTGFLVRQRHFWLRDSLLAYNQAVKEHDEQDSKKIFYEFNVGQIKKI